MVRIIELQRFLLPYCYRNHRAKFEIDRKFLTCLNKRKELTVTDGPTLIIEKHTIRVVIDQHKKKKKWKIKKHC